MSSHIEVRHSPEASRFEVVVDGAVAGVADYVDEGDAVVFPHTEIDPDRRGTGLGERLVRGALDEMAERGRQVVPACWYVAQFIEEHPEYRRLVAA